jgi:DNA-binding phage protein
VARQRTVESAIWQALRADLARRLAAVRGRRISQQQIAEVGGLDQNNYVSRLVHQPNPSLDTVVRVLWGLGVKPSEFFAQLEAHCPTPEPEWASAANARPPSTTPVAADHEEAAQRARLLELRRTTLHAYQLAHACLLGAKDDHPKPRR